MTCLKPTLPAPLAMQPPLPLQHPLTAQTMPDLEQVVASAMAMLGLGLYGTRMGTFPEHAVRRPDAPEIEYASWMPDPGAIEVASWTAHLRTPLR